MPVVVEKLPRSEKYVPADDEDRLRESPKHNLQMDHGLDGLRAVGGRERGGCEQPGRGLRLQ